MEKHRDYLFLFIGILFSFSAWSKPLELNITAPSAILMNADTGAILYEKQAHIPMYPASITKIATALYVLEDKNPDLNRLITVSSEAVKIKPLKPKGDVPAYWDEVDGTKMGIIRGEILPLEALLFGLMRRSGNDAANTIAEATSSSIPDFLDELNQYIKNLGCKNTQFRNPHGLHNDDHYSTAFDMCLIMRRALQNHKFREIVSNSFYQKPQTNKKAPEEIRQLNPLLKEGKHYYPKVIGAKTGFHSKAKHTLVAAAEHKGRTLIAVFLGCEKRTDRYEDARNLFDLAFSEQQETLRFFEKEHLFPYLINGATSSLEALLSTELSITYFPSEKPVCRAFIHWDSLELPIRKGQKVGQVQICNAEGKSLQTSDLVAKEDVKATFYYILRSYFNRIFTN